MTHFLYLFFRNWPIFGSKWPINIKISNTVGQNGSNWPIEKWNGSKTGQNDPFPEISETPLSIGEPPTGLFGYFRRQNKNLKSKIFKPERLIQTTKKGFCLQTKTQKTINPWNVFSLVECFLNKKSYCMDILVILNTITEAWVSPTGVVTAPVWRTHTNGHRGKTPVQPGVDRAGWVGCK